MDNEYNIVLGAEIDLASVNKSLETVKAQLANNQSVKLNVNISQDAVKASVQTITKELNALQSQFKNTLSVQINNTGFEEETFSLQRLNAALKERNSLELQITKAQQNTTYNSQARNSEVASLRTLVSMNDEWMDSIIRSISSERDMELAIQATVKANEQLNASQQRVTASNKQNLGEVKNLTAEEREQIQVVNQLTSALNSRNTIMAKLVSLENSSVKDTNATQSAIAIQEKLLSVEQQRIDELRNRASVLGATSKVEEAVNQANLEYAAKSSEIVAKANQEEKTRKATLDSYNKALKERNSLALEITKWENNTTANSAQSAQVVADMKTQLATKEQYVNKIKEEATSLGLNEDATRMLKTANDELALSQQKVVANANTSQKEQLSILNQLNAAYAKRNQLSVEITKLENSTSYNETETQRALSANHQLLAVEEQRIASLTNQVKGKENVETATKAQTQADLQLQAAQSKVIASSNDTVNIFKNMAAGLKEATARIFDYTLAYRGLALAGQAVRYGIETTQELDKSLVNLQIVTGGTREETHKLLLTYNEMAQAMSSTTTAVAEAGNEFLRQGLNVAETNDMITASQYLSKLGMVENTEAIQYVTSATQGYQLAASEAMDVVDKLTKVDVEAAVSAGYLAEAMARTANSAQQAGTSMDALIGYIAVIGETTQRSASTVGESLKTLFSRLITRRPSDLNHWWKIFSKYLGSPMRWVTGWNYYQNQKSKTYEKMCSLWV